MAKVGFVEGFWENLANFTPARPVEKGEPLLGRNIAREFVQLGRCISLSKSSCFAAFKIENGHVWQLDSNRLMVNYFVNHHLVTLLSN